MPQATLHDDSTIDLTVAGSGPTVLVAVDELTKGLVDELADTFHVVGFDLTAHTMATPKPDTLTPDNLAADLLAIADAAGAERFAYYGYSWLALAGLQLAIRTDRLDALVMGGYPPLDGPYAEMLAVTEATHQLSLNPKPSEPATQPAQPAQDGEIDWETVELTVPEPVTRQFMTLYQGLRGFDDRAAQPAVQCPRLAVVGSADRIVYSERWGGVTVDLAGPVVRNAAELRELGWDVEVLEGLDHLTAMQPANLLPVLEPWLANVLTRR
ncbi:alpha/beta fold hydrolase [Tenggerimyces flavus]|uniref:Alpha/beta fold hydrolase n=1 Tax=Tenggerimyces flavus TaxID=1708749 RepID=A0ABV7YJK3_9ACTN|nr:alpha/beta hydrolase [Tenggerimyces flavus]MBM7783948.1 pimeloyl-ACP methyl ester carboxylesterase [Tenggerimyces flavus]